MKNKKWFLVAPEEDVEEFNRTKLVDVSILKNVKWKIEGGEDIKWVVDKN